VKYTHVFEDENRKCRSISHNLFLRIMYMRKPMICSNSECFTFELGPPLAFCATKITGLNLPKFPSYKDLSDSCLSLLQRTMSRGPYSIKWLFVLSQAGATVVLSCLYSCESSDGELIILMIQLFWFLNSCSIVVEILLEFRTLVCAYTVGQGQLWLYLLTIRWICFS
jgi:hypothetical protein